MKVQIQYTTDVSDNYRRAIREYYGKKGLATREEVKRWLHTYGSSMDDNLMTDMTEWNSPGGRH